MSASPSSCGPSEKVFCQTCDFEFEAQSSISILGDLIATQPDGPALCPSCGDALNEVTFDVV